mmetsp:Transcript_17834/g.40976  ORF Transcript_17834/g.40976 Transcript_17834/m.40976 type:complete len:649 (-) Transcript_17834:603-2549(-)
MSPSSPEADADMEGTLRGLGNSEMLRIANTLDGIFAGAHLSGEAGQLKQPEVPRLVVVGTQSSGKSSLLNGIIGADILPLGEQMVTRAPLSLQLLHHPDPAGMRAEFGRYADGGWMREACVALTCPDPTAGQLAQIRTCIDEATEARAGKQKGVSADPIFLRIFSPHVPNLSLVDLPGMTMTALTDQGQPRDIKQQIRKMIGSYIQQERTIILMVCPARADLEADPAIELVKEYDPKGVRTIGVLTKIDLMNAGTDVGKCLTNSLPADLQLSLGYFAVRNRSPAESGRGGLSVRDGFAAEEAYFKQHPTYGAANNPYQDHLGVPKLTKFLSRVLLDRLRQHMPAILSEVRQLYQATEASLNAMGPAVPTDELARSSMVQGLLTTFCRCFVGALVEKRADLKTGRHIKDAFHALNQGVKAVQPFDNTSFSDEYILEGVRDCEGYKLAFPIPPIELVEHMLRHPEHRPIRQLLPPCVVCLSSVHDEIRNMTRVLLQQQPMCRFPKLSARIREEVEALLLRAQTMCQAKLEELIDMEENYIMTDDPAFLTEMAGVVKKLVNRLDAPLIRSILVSYFSTVQRSLNNSAPKAIMLYMVKGIHDSIYQTLFEKINLQPSEHLLDEPPEMDAKRRADMELLAKLRSARRALETMG